MKMYHVNIFMEKITKVAININKYIMYEHNIYIYIYIYMYVLCIFNIHLLYYYVRFIYSNFQYNNYSVNKT